MNEKKYAMSDEGFDSVKKDNQKWPESPGTPVSADTVEGFFSEFFWLRLFDTPDTPDTPITPLTPLTPNQTLWGTQVLRTHFCNTRTYKRTDKGP